MSKPYVSQLAVTPLVHRARGFGEAENTTLAIEAALRNGFTYVETDVQTTADGIAVLYHDRETTRLTGSARSIRHILYADLIAQIRQPAQDPPQLIDVLWQYPTLRLNLDLKDWHSVTSVPDVIRRTGAGERVCVTSFSDRRLAAARRQLSDVVCTGMGVVRASTICLAALGAPLRFATRQSARHADVLQIPFYNSALAPYRRIVEYAKTCGLAAHAWTVNARVAMEDALDAGFDGIVTDSPFELKALLLERGLWTAG